MPTSVHFPKPLLAALDRRAKAMRVSRSRLIVRAVERELKQANEWSPELLAWIDDADEERRAAVDEMMAFIRAGRRSKRPLQL